MANSGAAQGESGRGGFSCLAILFGLAALVCAVVWCASLFPGPSNPDDGWALWLALIGLTVGQVVHLALHELGHLIACWVFRLPVLGVRIGPLRWGVARNVPAARGHVLYDISKARRPVPARAIGTALAGPAANLAGAAVTAIIALDAGQPPTLRGFAVGVTVAGVFMGVGNLVPRTVRGETPTDGLRALRWWRRPGEERARVARQLRIATLRPGGIDQGASAFARNREQWLAMLTDPSPEVAVSAMSELLHRRPRHDDGWQDADAVARFVERRDLDPHTRATVGGNYSLSLALSYLRTLAPGQLIDPAAAQVGFICRLAELVREADSESLPARTALGMARVLQDRAGEARGLLIDVPSTTTHAAQARAHAVRGLAEMRLGDADQARRLCATARRLSADEPLVMLLDRGLTASAAAQDPAP